MKKWFMLAAVALCFALPTNADAHWRVGYGGFYGYRGPVRGFSIGIGGPWYGYGYGYGPRYGYGYGYGYGVPVYRSSYVSYGAPVIYRPVSYGYYGGYPGGYCGW